MPITAMSDEFLGAFGRIPKHARKKVREFTRKFQHNPTSSGINYEKLSGKVDKRLRSVRVGIDYRAIVLAPKAGDVYVLLWVDHHDEAYQWAERRRVEVHPKTGALQVYQTYEGGPERQASPEAPRQVASDRFRALSDEQLFAAGVPQALLPAVRVVHTDADFDALAPHLPVEAAEVLTGIAAGMSLDEALEEVLGGSIEAARPDTEVDIADVAAALERVESTRRFQILGEDFDLEAALEYPLDAWRVFLHPSQRRLVERPTKGPARVLGAAGTGKTVVAMHRAVSLLRNHLAAGERILFTTFTVNLAKSIARQLAKIATPEELERTEVISIDALASRLARRGGIELRLALTNETRELWNEACDIYGDGTRGLAFYQAEWTDVIQAQDLKTESEYVSARRLGRGTKMRRSERRAVWPVFERYRESLLERGLAESSDLLRYALRTAQTEDVGYAAVLVDEAQDMTAAALELVRALAGEERPNDLFLVGDAHQRIYGRPVSMLACGINIRGRRSKRLRLNYRTTDAIRRFSMQVLEGERFDDLGNGEDDTRGHVSLRNGPLPEVAVFDDLAGERAHLVRIIQKLTSSGISADHICVASRTREQLKSSYGPALQTAGIPFEVLDRTEPKGGRVFLSTMHRAKGLEFPVVVLVGMDRGHVPLQTPELDASDPVVAGHAMKRERCLLYVAASRARDQLFVSASGTPSPFLEAADPKSTTE